MTDEMSIPTREILRLTLYFLWPIISVLIFISVFDVAFILRGFMVQLVITSLLRSEGPRFEPGWNHFYAEIRLSIPSYNAPPGGVYHDYLFMTVSLVGSYQVGYTRSHPNTEVKMLRACSVPLCSHRWERQVIYLFDFFLIYYYIIYILFLFLTHIHTTYIYLCNLQILYKHSIDSLFLVYVCFLYFLLYRLIFLLLYYFLFQSFSIFYFFCFLYFFYVLLSFLFTRGFMVQLVITSLLRSEGPRFEPGWNHFISFILLLSVTCTFLFLIYRQVHIKQDTPVPIRTRK